MYKKIKSGLIRIILYKFIYNGVLLLIMSNNKSVLISLSLGEEYCEKFERLREKTGISKTEQVRRWIDKALEDL